MKLSIEHVLEKDLKDCLFLHEQGQTVLRGYVSSFVVKDGNWELNVRDVEYLDKSSYEWRKDSDEDYFGGQTDHHFSADLDEKDGLVSIQGYGMEIIISTDKDKPLSKIDWPELDGFEGGRMTN